MRALVCDADGLHLDLAHAEPRPRPGEALIRLRLGGICNTDREIIQGYMAFQGVLGHEFVGDVVSAEDPAWVGRRVVGDINAACYRCETCLAGNHTHCPHRTTLGIYGRDGAFADYFCLPMANLYPVPDGLSDEAAVFTEPLAAACELLEQIAMRPGLRVLVLGDGKLGLLVSAVLRLTGVDLLLVGHHPAKLAIAQNWGIRTSGTGNVVGRPADVVVECTGRQEGLLAALGWLRPRGTLALKSTYHGNVTLNMSALVVDEITLVGSRCGPFAPALRLLAGGLVDPRPLISGVYPLTDGLAAFDRAAIPGVVKILLEGER